MMVKKGRQGGGRGSVQVERLLWQVAHGQMERRAGSLYVKGVGPLMVFLLRMLHGEGRGIRQLWVLRCCLPHPVLFYVFSHTPCFTSERQEQREK